MNKISAFGSAIRAESVTAEIDVDDVMEAAPQLDRAQARQWLQQHEQAVGQAMVIAGMRELLRQMGGGHDGG